MTTNCNRIKREGNCDGIIWTECTYCGAIDNEACINIKKYTPTYEEQYKELLGTALKTIRSKSLHPAEVQAVLIYILDELDSRRI